MPGAQAWMSLSEGEPEVVVPTVAVLPRLLDRVFGGGVEVVPPKTVGSKITRG